MKHQSAAVTRGTFVGHLAKIARRYLIVDRRRLDVPVEITGSLFKHQFVRLVGVEHTMPKKM